MNRSKLKNFVLVFANLLALPLASANNCPDFTGTYSCPEYTGHPAYTLEINQSDEPDGTTVYNYYYSYLHDWRKITGSDEGTVMSIGNWVAQCGNDNGSKFIVYYPIDADPFLDGTFNYINENGDYQADYRGIPQIVCTRN